MHSNEDLTRLYPTHQIGSRCGCSYKLSFCNVSANPEEPACGYELFFVISLLAEMSTSTFADPARILFFADGTNEEPGLSSTGYWSMDSDGHHEIETGELFWFGCSSVQIHSEVDCWETHRPPIFGSAQHFCFLQQEPPSVAALNSQPIMETASASTTVDIVSGAVQRFSIIDGPTVVTSARSENYEVYHSTGPLSDGDSDQA